MAINLTDFSKTTNFKKLFTWHNKNLVRIYKFLVKHLSASWLLDRTKADKKFCTEFINTTFLLKIYRLTSPSYTQHVNVYNTRIKSKFSSLISFLDSSVNGYKIEPLVQRNFYKNLSLKFALLLCIKNSSLPMFTQIYIIWQVYFFVLSCFSKFWVQTLK